MGKVGRRGEVRHKRKLNKSPEQIHADQAFPVGVKCQGGCGRRPIVRAITMAPLDEVKKRMPDFDLQIMQQPKQILDRVVQIREHKDDHQGKPYVRLGLAYACEACAPAMERELAKAPSWMIVEINRGPSRAPTHDQIV